MNYEDCKNKYIAVDLHVHTPISKCYQKKGNLTEDEHYLNVLKVFKEKKVKLLAITDHNTLGGYKKLLEIKKKIEKNINDIEKSLEINENELIKLKDQLNLYNEVKLIPGVEFTAYPHIHILLLFDENLDLTKVENFLEECGYDSADKQGKDLVNLKKLSVEEVIKIGYDMGAITIAAHIDRETGLLHDYEQKNINDYSIFTSPYLQGVHVLKPDTIDKLRKFSDVVCIKASDFHNEMTDIEKRNTFMKLSTINFMGLKEAFQNSNEKIILKWFDEVEI